MTSPSKNLVIGVGAATPAVGFVRTTDPTGIAGSILPLWTTRILYPCGNFIFAAIAVSASKTTTAIVMFFNTSIILTLFPFRHSGCALLTRTTFNPEVRGPLGHTQVHQGAHSKNLGLYGHVVVSLTCFAST